MGVAPEQVTVVVTTYNRPDALELVLQGLAHQSVQGFEVIVADDGSTADTASLIQQQATSSPYSLQHVWQPDEGFRAAASRNRALAVTSTDYIIFIDGDCVPRVNFIEQHCRFAEPGWFIAGNRILLSEKFTQKVIAFSLPLWGWGLGQWLSCFIQGQAKRVHPILFTLPNNGIRKLKPHRWQGAKTCNIGVWRQDLIDINGLDETYHGWGHEDADMVIRLIRNGILRKEGRYGAPVFHLWHAHNDRSREQLNQQRLAHILQSTNITAELGVNQYLSN
ncbi:MAG: glycosyltransferase family 2 protein [Pseudomonadota bacterium]